jgi:hypothetical protein
VCVCEDEIDEWIGTDWDIVLVGWLGYQPPSNLDAYR